MKTGKKKQYGPKSRGEKAESILTIVYKSRHDVNAVHVISGY